MLEAISALLISLAIFGINFYISKNVFYPPSLFALIWSVVFLSYVFFLLGNDGKIFELDLKTILCLIAGEIIFSLSGLLALKNKKEIKHIVQKPQVLYNIDKWLLLFLVLMLPVYISALLKIVSASKLADINIYLALRDELINNDATVGVLNYINTVSFFSFALALYKFNFTDYKLNTIKAKLYKYAHYLVAFIYAFLSTGRTFFVILFCIYLGFKVISKSFKRYHYTTVFVGFLVLFVANALILGKGGSVYASFGENIEMMSETIVIYFLGGVYGLDSLFKSNYALGLGENVLRFFVAVGHAVGISDDKPKALIMPYITTPIVSNVYSLYYIYIKDFWYFGILFNAIWGYIHTFFYCRVSKGFMYIYCYALLLYPLLMSFFQDQYMTLLSTWIQMVFFALLFLPFVKKPKLAI